jgi:hexosaminidase
MIGSLLTPASPVHAETATTPLTLPRLRNWTPIDGSVRFTEDSRILVDPGSRGSSTTPAGRAELPGPAHQTTQELAKRLQDDLRQATGFEPPIRSDVQHAAPGDVVLRLVDDAALGAEGYRLDSSGPVRVEAASTHGLYYGTRTLLQLLRDRAFPKGATEDRPTQRVRLVVLDAGREYWDLAYLERLVRKMGDLDERIVWDEIKENA